MKAKHDQTIFKAVTITVTIIGAIVSLYFMFLAGSQQKSLVLIGLFTGWVLSPFIGLLIVYFISSKWVSSVRSSIYWLMSLVPVCAMLIYSGIFPLASEKPAFSFLVAPLISWLVIVTAFLLARRINKNKLLQYGNS